MRIDVRAGTGGARALHEAAERRLRFALGRFQGRIAGVRVRFHDINGPRGGVDQACQVSVRLGRPSALVVIEERDVDVHAALARAADRAARAVGRLVEQARWERASPVTQVELA
jgi:putative sigma-54 modulation protein